jgi:hypothetical protein
MEGSLSPYLSTFSLLIPVATTVVYTIITFWSVKLDPESKEIVVLQPTALGMSHTMPKLCPSIVTFEMPVGTGKQEAMEVGTVMFEARW